MCAAGDRAEIWREGRLAGARFYRALLRDGLNVIAELKRASPSRGVIREPFDAAELATIFVTRGRGGAFGADRRRIFSWVAQKSARRRKTADLPVLRKDFIFDRWQVWEARANDADSFLLIVAALPDVLLRDLLTLGREIGMEPVIEVHTAEELQRALDASARIIGVNNRDLKTMTVRVETSLELIEKIPESCVAISESGIRSHDDLVVLRRRGIRRFPHRRASHAGARARGGAV